MKPFVALIRPSFDEMMNQVTYPLGLGYLASALKNEGFMVRIFDLNILGIKNQEFIEYLKKINVDFIGITALTFYFQSMVELCHLIKDCPELSNIPLIIGGVHVTSFPEYSLKKTKADFAVIGEGEITIIDLINCSLNNGNFEAIKGIGYLKSNDYIQTPQRDLIPELDKILPPAWELMHVKLYPDTPHGLHYKASPIFPIFTSRGCPHECIYCASKNFWQRRIRFHSIQRVVDEVEFLIKNHNAKEIHIWDDNFTLNSNRTIEFCREILKRKIKVHFACPNGVRIDTLNKKVLKYMKNAGFYSLTFAVESGSPRIQKVIKKNLNLDIVPSIISNAHKLGFINRAFFIIGLPNETKSEIYKTINLACKLKIDQANCFIFTPLPGSSFFTEWVKDCPLDSINWNFDFLHNPQKLGKYSKIDPNQLTKFVNLFFIKFLLFRPDRLIKLILRMHPSLYLYFVKFFFFTLKFWLFSK